MEFCPRCKAFVNRETTVCPECGYNSLYTPLKYSYKKRGVAIIVTVGIIMAAFVVISTNAISLINSGIDDSSQLGKQVKEQLESAKNVIANVPDTVQKSSEVIRSVPGLAITRPSYSNDELVQYALQKINEDRQKQGLKPVLLSDNDAAQIHAEDVLKTDTISHWLSNGEKPYMTFTRYGGTGAVSQNVAISSCSGLGCSTDAIKEIDKAENLMVYDDADSNWGHRDNILRPYHTHVSIGIAYTNNFFVLVQNFEDNYIEFLQPIGQTYTNLKIEGNLKKGKMLGINIYYDKYPSESLYEIHKDDKQYQMGELMAVVEKPLPIGYYYNEIDCCELIVANSWSENERQISIDFDISSVTTNSGVYTVGVWINDGENDILATSHSVFVQ